MTEVGAEEDAPVSLSAGARPLMWIRSLTVSGAISRIAATDRCAYQSAALRSGDPAPGCVHPCGAGDRPLASSLADLGSLLAEAEPATAQRIAQALFEQVEVLGPNEIWLYPSLEAQARGWATAMTGGFQAKERQTGRGERDSPATNDLPIAMRLAEPPEPVELVRSA